MEFKTSDLDQRHVGSLSILDPIYNIRRDGETDDKAVTVEALKFFVTHRDTLWGEGEKHFAESELVCHPYVVSDRQTRRTEEMKQVSRWMSLWGDAENGPVCQPYVVGDPVVYDTQQEGDTLTVFVKVETLDEYVERVVGS